MNNLSYKKIFLFIGYLIFIVLITSFQVSFLNPSYLGLNIVLGIILILVFYKKNISAVLTAWILGLMTGLSSYSIFGLKSLVFLFLTLILIIFHKNISFTLKPENMILASVGAVVSYRFIDWALNNIIIYLNKSYFENLDFYFLNWGIVSEITLISFFVIIVFNTKLINDKKIF